MPKLKGLLDSANAKLAGLLGDFPQGFNAGAVAGFPGWAGDMAYLADTARLALTGADSQAAPEDYVGTTDYIAKQAGYPVPQTLSGQLGAAVGGLMSPGPGDLAKFAPVLSAIPFWHGSPHKYDAVDLSKIGTGEGAQAYGHGYYGADSVDTATAYRDTLTNRTPFHIEMSLKDKGISPELANTYAQFAAQTGGAKASADDFIELMSRDAPSGPIRDFRERLKPEFPSLRSAVKEINGNLYRGEYRWPDPAKEAATPLTGEDLLDWDKPLSEQSPQVQKALGIPVDAAARYRDITAQMDSMQSNGGLDTPEWNALLSEARALREQYGLGMTGGEKYRSLHEQAILTGKAKPAKVKEEEVVKRLNKSGIPGIRYLDQMSRGAGEGTRNYVMFDDKGIKLLERNGEQIGRQPITAYHKTDAEFDEFDPAFFGKNDNGYAGRGVYLTPKPLPGFTYGKDTLKVSAALENPYIRTKDSWNTDPLDPYTWIPKRTQELGGKPQDRTTASEEWTQMMRSKGHDGFIDEATDGGEIVVFDPKQAKILERNGSPIEDFAARRAGKAKPYKEAVGLPMDEASRMQRASEQGYNTDVYHGTAEDVTAFDPSKFGAATGAHSAKQGVWTVSDPTTAAGYAQYAANDAKIKALIDEAGKWEKKGDWDRYDNAIAAAEELEVAQRNADWMGGQNVMPLKVRGKYLEQDMAGAEFVDVEKDIKGIIARAKREGYDGVKFNNLADDVGRNARPATHVLTFDPKNIRAKTAAFDPKNKDSANLLAGTTAAAVGLGAYKRHSDEQRRRRVD